jgi:hypothetical protein
VTEVFGEDDMREPPSWVLRMLLMRAAERFDDEDVWMLIGETKGRSKKKKFFVVTPSESVVSAYENRTEDGPFKVEFEEKVDATSTSIEWVSRPTKIVLYSNYNREVVMSISTAQDKPVNTLRLLRAHVAPSNMIRTYFYGDKTAIDGRWPRASMPNQGDMIVVPKIWNPDTESFNLGWEMRVVERAAAGRPDAEGRMVQDGSVTYFYAAPEGKAKLAGDRRDRTPLILSPVVRHLKLRPGEFILPTEPNKFLWRYLEDIVIIVQGNPSPIERLREGTDVAEAVELVTKSAVTGESLLERPPEGFPVIEREPGARRTMPIPRKHRPEFAERHVILAAPPQAVWGEGANVENVPPSGYEASGRRVLLTEEQIQAAIRTWD